MGQLNQILSEKRNGTVVKFEDQDSPVVPLASRGNTQAGASNPMRARTKIGKAPTHSPGGGAGGRGGRGGGGGLGLGLGSSADFAAN